jgi:hypothetical protein
VFTLDMIVAIMFFIVIILSMLWVWGEAYRHMVDYRDMKGRQERLAQVATMLVKGGGNPPNWEYSQAVSPSSVKAIGLAREPNVLDEKKLARFMSADERALHEIMGLGSENFSLSVTEGWSTSPRVIYRIGNATTSNERLIVRRYALFNGSRVELKLEASYNKK